MARSSLKLLVFAALICVTTASQLLAQAPGRQARGLFGDWLIKSDFNGRQMESILSFGRDADGNQTAALISLFGVNELQDVSYTDGTLKFAWVIPTQQGETRTSQFTGTIAEGALTGAFSGEMGEIKVTGERAPRMPMICGDWLMKSTMGEREITSTLEIRADEEGALKGVWKSRRGESEVTDLNYERGTLTFKRSVTFQENTWESTFEGTFNREGTITGAFKSDRGEIAVEGTRIGADLIGTWNLEIASEMGARKQRLRVNPDLSALYGSLPVEKVTLEENAVSFKVVTTFGENSFEMDFAGTIADGKLTGELTTTRGTQKVTGEKVVRNFPRRPAQQ
ncbi:MAG: hypothetical protein QM518_03110 [Verrucomicrobiota bacterium]|jgi:hypothetical protein|nr:hypothetical protein [Verrucomicrobiota bacterium]HCF94296.1 hypothetical protein [Verrucomicrobiota bacterium]